jgi:hypothetical protein
MTMSRHPADYLSLTFGVLFAAAGVLLLAGRDVAPSFTWIAPVGIIAVGAVIILAARSSGADSADLPAAD